MLLKCDWCGIKFANAPVHYAHRHFCRETCKMDWVETQTRIAEAQRQEHAYKNQVRRTQ